MSRLGIHAIQPGGQEINWIRDMATAGRPFVAVKGVDCPQLAVTVKQVSPQTTTIVRFMGYDDLQPISDSTSPNYAAIAARAFIPYDGMTDVQKQATDFFEVCNEPSPPGVDGYARLSTLMKYMIDEANHRGAKILLFTLNAGTPEWNQMKAMAASGVFEMAKAGGHALALHDGVFGRDDIRAGYGDAIPGAPYVPGSGPFCFRYRFLYQLLKEHNAVIPLYITEMRVNGGGCGISDVEAVERFAWYDENFSQDVWARAVLPFTVAPTTGWLDHDYGYAMPMLMQYMKTHTLAKLPTNQAVLNLIGQWGADHGINLIGRTPYDLLHAMVIDRQGPYLGPKPTDWMPQAALSALETELLQTGWREL